MRLRLGAKQSDGGPSIDLLEPIAQTTATLEQAQAVKKRGLHFDSPRINPEQLNDWKEGVVDQLGKGLTGLVEQRKVKVAQGKAAFEEEDLIRVETEDCQSWYRLGSDQTGDAASE